MVTCNRYFLEHGGSTLSQPGGANDLYALASQAVVWNSSCVNDVVPNLGLMRNVSPKEIVDCNMHLPKFATTLTSYFLYTETVNQRRWHETTEMALTRSLRCHHGLRLELTRYVETCWDMMLVLKSCGYEWGVKMCESELQTVHQTWRWDSA